MENTPETNDPIQINDPEADKPIESSTPDNNDPYAYLNRDEFTSEKYKIEIRDLPKYYGISVSTSYKIFANLHLLIFRK